MKLAYVYTLCRPLDSGYMIVTPEGMDFEVTVKITNSYTKDHYGGLGLMKLIFTKPRNLVSLEQSHHTSRHFPLVLWHGKMSVFINIVMCQAHPALVKKANQMCGSFLLEAPLYTVAHEMSGATVCRSGPPVDGPKDPWPRVLSLPKRFVGDPDLPARDNIYTILESNKL